VVGEGNGQVPKVWGGVKVDNVSKVAAPSLLQSRAVEMVCKNLDPKNVKSPNCRRLKVFVKEKLKQIQISNSQSRQKIVAFQSLIALL